MNEDSCKNSTPNKIQRMKDVRSRLDSMNLKLLSITTRISISIIRI